MEMPTQAQREAMKRYSHTEKGRATRKRYRQKVGKTPEGKEKRRRACRLYYQRHKEEQKLYSQRHREERNLRTRERERAKKTVPLVLILRDLIEDVLNRKFLPLPVNYIELSAEEIMSLFGRKKSRREVRC